MKKSLLHRCSALRESARKGRAALTTTLLAGTCLAAIGFAATSAFDQEGDGVQAAVPQDEAPQDEASQKKTGQDGAGQDGAGQDDTKTPQSAPPANVGRSRLSGRKTPPKSKSVPRAVRAKAPGALPGSALDLGPAQKPAPPKYSPDMTLEERQQAKLEYTRQLRAYQDQQNGTKRPMAAPLPPRNDNAKIDITYGEEVHDFGRSLEGNELTHTFKMRSAGSEPLIISSASPTCGCLVNEIKVKEAGQSEFLAYTKGDPIPPGSEIELTASLDTTGKRSNTQVRIQVATNDASTATVSLVLKAFVQPFLTATPQFLQLNQVRQGTEKTAEVTFRTHGGEKVMLTRDTTYQVPVPAGLSFNLEPVNPDENGKSNEWKAKYTIAPDAKLGGAGYALKLNTDIKIPSREKYAESDDLTEQQKKKQKSISPYYQVMSNLNYTVVGALSLQPEYISLGVIRPGQPQVRGTRLTSHEPDFDLSKVTATVRAHEGMELKWPEHFSVDLQPVAGANAVDVQLRVAGLPDDADGAFRGLVVVDTGHPTMGEMELRFTGVVRKLAGSAQRPPQVRKAGVADQANQVAAKKAAQEAAKKAAQKAGQDAGGNSDG